MILQALCDYFARKGDLAPQGFEYKEVPFVMVLNPDGTVALLKDTREGEGRKKRGKVFLVPKDCGRTSGIAANLLWDKPDYSLGYVPEGASEKESEKIKRRHQAFKDEITQWFPPGFDDAGIEALRRFLEADHLPTIVSQPYWPEVLTHTGAVISFSLLGDSGQLLCERPAVKQHILQRLNSRLDNPPAFCLVHGQPDTLATLHPAIKGVPGSQTSGAMLVSFNASAFTSYGKSQGANSPVGELAAFEYTTALNHLLGTDSQQKIQLGNTTVVYWAERPTPLVDDVMATMFLESGYITAEELAQQQAHPDEGTQAVFALLNNSPYKGEAILGDEPEKNRFFVLGVSPNAARLAVRFWQVQTVAELGKNLKQHFKDMALATKDYPQGGKPLPLRQLLRSIAVQRKLDNIPPKLEGEVLRAMLNGTAYPQTLLLSALQRCRAEQSVTYTRACLLKGCLNRMAQEEKEKLPMALDVTNDNIGYCLGRLFAVLERLQESANPGINATIADRYFASASTRPLVAFTPLMRLRTHHLAKLEAIGLVVYYKKTIGEIVAKFPSTGFPNQLSMEDQGRFVVGYYHQRHARKANPTPVLEQPSAVEV